MAKKEIAFTSWSRKWVYEKTSEMLILSLDIEEKHVRIVIIP
jgi:hypothetical protein